MPGIIALVLIAILALIILSFTLHFRFSPAAGGRRRHPAPGSSSGRAAHTSNPSAPANPLPAHPHIPDLGVRAPSTHERRPSPGVAGGDPGAAHEIAHRLCGLSGEQFDVVEPDPAAPVEVGHELPGERDWLREALPDRAARPATCAMLCSARTAVTSWSAYKASMSWISSGPDGATVPAGPDRHAQVVRGAQDGLA